MVRLLVLVQAIALAPSHPVRPDLQGSGVPDTVAVRVGPLTLRGLLWRPAGAGPFPAVLFNHGSGPASDPSRPSTLGPAFAGHGYLCLYLFRRGAGLSAGQGTDSETLMKRALREKGQEGLNQVQLRLLETELTDVRAGIAFLRGLAEVDRQRIAVAGHSFGGQLSLLVAERDSGVRAAVVFGAAAVSWDPSPRLRTRLLAAVRRTTAAVFFIHAENDYSVAAGTALAAEMTRLAKPNRLAIYPAIGRTAAEGHDFVHTGLSVWEADVFAFLDERLRAPGIGIPAARGP